MTEPLANNRRQLTLRVVLFTAFWMVGATIARGVGLWKGIGGMALLLGTVALVLYHKDLKVRLKPTRPALLTAGAAALLMLAATYLLYPVVSLHIPYIARETSTLYTDFGHASVVELLLLFAIVICEEIVWRGIIQGSIETRLAPVPAVLLCGALYAAAHAPAGSPLLVLLALVCGIFWSALRAYSGSLLPALIAHMVWDAAVFQLAPLVTAHR
ncbi:MAG: CPBP family intramembrane metalloprotease [Armatimonadota bacterium]|nr:CPBP family intramembrane metalloprotease [Armatimonadota bacterium]